LRPGYLFTLLATIPPYWAAYRMIFTLRMGNDSTEEGKKVLKEASPLFRAAQIKAPLLILQGANDPRVKKTESEQIIVALRNQGKNVSYILADDEGHGSHKPINTMAAFAAEEKFLAKYCGTRYQESIPDDVAKRLKQMTIDVNTVTVSSAHK
jgi:dipeptidyl aminopeptidase/acylaminoacyl peptidase